VPQTSKLVFVNRYFDPDQSATSQMLTDLARGLVARGLRVRVVCSRQLYTNAAAELLRRENRSGVAVYRVGTTRFGRAHLLGRAIDYASFYFSAGAALMKIIGAGDVVIAKTDPPLISVLAALIVRLKGAVLVNWQQDVFPDVAAMLGMNLPRWVDSLLRRLRDSSLRSAKMNVLIGHRMLEYFRRRGISDAQLCVIENWADADLIKPKAAGASALRARLGFTNELIVSYSGNLGRAHEFDTLLAAAQIVQSDPSIIFLIVGGGAKMEALRTAVQERTLDNFRFLPYQDRSELADSLAAADVHFVSLLPALEGFVLPSKLYGILAAGRPLLFVGDALGDIARTIGEAQCGMSVDINAGAELAAAIRLLQSDPQSRLNMGERAREAFLARHTLDIAIGKWMSVLETAAPQARISA
jgi:glycosyltransferase involved in cell wall biosynthesis